MRPPVPSASRRPVPIVRVLADTTLVGFDSAWADRVPGAICALVSDRSGTTRFEPPRPASFEAAAAWIARLHGSRRRTLVAIDQPTIVRNASGMRPCERVVASVASWSGGGIQPANREGVGKGALFGDGAPIWRFLDQLGFRDDPEAARAASRGGFVMEVFPALALLDYDPAFVGRGAGPRYNPARGKTFSQESWRAVCGAATREAERLGLAEVAAWCAAVERDARPRKASQDQLDSVICLLIAARWLGERADCAMIGDHDAGYIVAPARGAVRARLVAAAARIDVAVR